MRISVVLLVLMLLFSMATGTMAAAVGYLDMVAGGTVDKEGHGVASAEDDLKMTMISAGTMLNEKFKVGAEYGFGTIEGPKEEDVSLWSVKVGYRLVDKLAFKLDGVVAPLIIDTDTSMLRTMLVGLESTVYFSKKLFLTGTYVMGQATYEKDGLNKNDGVPTDMLRLKFHYFITDNVGLFVGYTKMNYEFDVVPTALNVKLGSMDVGMGGTTLGLIYKF